MCCERLQGFLAGMVDNTFGTNLRSGGNTSEFSTGVKQANGASLAIASILLVDGAISTTAGGGGLVASGAVASTGVGAPVGGIGAAASGGLLAKGAAELTVGGIMMANTISNMKDDASSSNNSSSSSSSRNKPKQEGEPNTSEIQARDSDGNVTKYSTFDENGKLVKEFRGTGKDHGNIPRPNVKEPNVNTNPKTGEQFQNGFKVRKATPEELPKVNN